MANAAQDLVNGMYQYSYANPSQPDAFIAGMTPYASGGSMEPGTSANPTPTYTYANGGSAGSAQDVQNAADTAAYYQSQIDNLNGQNGRLDSQLNTGLDNYQNSYNQAKGRLDQQKGFAEQNFNTQTQDNKSQYSRNRSAIQSQTANRANALQRLLGIAGAGNSSAAYEQAPYAAGIQGTRQLDDAQQAYGTNGRNLDMSWQRTLADYNNNSTDLNDKLHNGQNALRSSINQTRASLLGQIQGLGQQRDMAQGSSYQTARNNQAGYQAQINSLLDSIAGLGRQNTTVSTGDVNFAAPDMQQYFLNQGKTGTVQAGNPGTSDVNPIFAPLLNQQRDEFGNLIAA
jgi:hypothetical protein